MICWPSASSALVQYVFSFPSTALTAPWLLSSLLLVACTGAPCATSSSPANEPDCVKHMSPPPDWSRSWPSAVNSQADAFELQSPSDTAPLEASAPLNRCLKEPYCRALPNHTARAPPGTSR